MVPLFTSLIWFTINLNTSIFSNPKVYTLVKLAQIIAFFFQNKLKIITSQDIMYIGWWVENETKQNTCVDMQDGQLGMFSH